MAASTVPNVSTRQVGGNTVIELQIEFENDDATCSICANTFCSTGQCCQTATHLTCCTQRLCTRCALKMGKRCRCTNKCRMIVAICPYCREVSAVKALELWQGSQKECTACCQRNQMVVDPEPGVENHEDLEEDEDDSSSISSTSSEGVFLNSID